MLILYKSSEPSNIKIKKAISLIIAFKNKCLGINATNTGLYNKNYKALLKTVKDPYK